MMKNNYMLIHGSFGSPFSNWIPWLREKIEEGGARCLYTQFSNRSRISKL